MDGFHSKMDKVYNRRDTCIDFVHLRLITRTDLVVLHIMCMILIPTYEAAASEYWIACFSFYVYKARSGALYSR